MTDAKGCQATPHGTLLEQIMDATQAKGEREWAASREIERNRAAIEELLQELRNIANADTFAWDDRTEFEAWAKNRARAAIAKHDTSTTTAKEQ